VNLFENFSIESNELVDEGSVTNIDKCIGCGVCSYHCPENARNLKRTGLRKVFIPPPKIAEHDLKLLET
jgi:ferredoxin